MTYMTLGDLPQQLLKNSGLRSHKILEMVPDTAQNGYK